MGSFLDSSKENAPETRLPPPLFHDVFYSVISPPQIPYDDPGFIDLLQELNENGATCVPLEDGRIKDLSRISHVITRSVDFPEYDSCLEQLKHIVKPNWIQISLAKNKQQNPRQYSPDPALFLNDVTVHCTGLPEGDEEAIYGAVLAMGGLVSENFTKLVTHLVALSIDDPMCETAKRKGIPCKIVLPHWFDDCLRLRRRISEEPYLLPDPEILQKDHDGPPITRNPSAIDTAISPTPPGSLLSSTPTFIGKEITIFKGNKVMLSTDLKIGQVLRSTLEDIIHRSNGSVTENVDEADYLVCQHRENDDFVKFWTRKDGKDVGNLSWLYHLIVHNRYTSPLNKLLHFPTPRRGIPGFENYIICISNYTGNARVYVENLVKNTGAQFSKVMAQNNTHLITAHTGSEKCEAAHEWNINSVNHVWLEDSYAKMKVQSLTLKCYTHFPPRTNLGEVVGSTPIDREVIRRWLQTKYPDRLKSAPSHVLSSNRIKLDVEDNRRSSGRRGRPASDSFTTPQPRRDNKENEQPDTPFTSGSRGAKSRALSKLHDAALDIALYDKERKRVGGVVHGRDRGRTSSQGPEPMAEPQRNSPKRPHEDTEESELEELAEPPGKKAKYGRRATKVRVMVSMYDRWQTKPELELAEKV
jgi:twin BRCT domain-containing protein/BRCA1-like protein